MESTNNLLDKPLSGEERQLLVSTLFGFSYETSDGGGKLYDSSDNEFFKDSKNHKYNFNTLRGIFAFSRDYNFERGVQQGTRALQLNIRELLGISI